MRRSALGTAAFIAALCFGSAASAGAYSDALNQCLERSIKDTDRVALVQWMFASFALNPSVKQFANINAGEREAVDRNMAQLVQRLLLVDCRTASVDALKNEGGGSIDTSFGVLVGAATRRLLSQPETTSAIPAYATYLDKPKFATLFKDAGVPTTP